jgi:hypothetical protein
MDCHCQVGYFRDPPSAENSFNCSLCLPGDFCFNNSAYNCSDELMHYEPGSGFVDNCTCVRLAPWALSKTGEKVQSSRVQALAPWALSKTGEKVQSSRVQALAPWALSKSGEKVQSSRVQELAPWAIGEKDVGEKDVGEKDGGERDVGENEAGEQSPGA